MGRCYRGSPVFRRALVLAAFSALASAGAASSLLPADPSPVAVTTTTSTTTTTTTTTRTTTARTTATVPTTTTASTTTGTTTTTPVVPPPALTESTAPSTVVFFGHGWGHGLGMSQWGAYGYALHGWTCAAILGHYYQGTTIGTVRPATVRVLLLDAARRVTLASQASWQVVDSEGSTVPLPPGKLVLTPALEVEGQALVAPLTFTPGAAPLEVASRAYRGRVVVAAAGSKLQVVNAVPVEAYLKGVVPSEVPSSWPAEALKAQAIAARSYALAGLSTVVTASNYDLYADTRSQVYGGIAAESPATRKAVQDTARQVVL